MSVLSVKEFPEELMVALRVRAAQERSTLRSIVIGELSKVTRVPNTAEALKQCKFIDTSPMLYAPDTDETVTGTVIAGPLERALVQIWPILVDFDKSMIVARLRKGRQRVKATKGRCEGGKRFGHYDGEMAILGVILALRAAHVSSMGIATRLNLEGRPSRSGKPWSGPVIAKILRREK
ncbi:MAG TPA: hypothetical protein VGU67_06745 [Edaphobacter sp.]|nr:hypothetical protein [Edaphobacter sp.]